jgi:hypothetical protein
MILPYAAIRANEAAPDLPDQGIRYRALAKPGTFADRSVAQRREG